jgi:competence protein ComFC
MSGTPRHEQKGVVGKWFTRLLDWVYPPSCGICETPLSQGRALCKPCREDLPRLAHPYCSICGEHFDGVVEPGFKCPNCHERKLNFDFARPALAHDPRAMSLIHDLKYRRHLHLAAELGGLAAEAFDDERLERAVRLQWPLIPVPLHPGRLRSRLFNQADEVAQVVGRIRGLQVLPALKRTRRTETQTRLTRHQRLANLRGAFAFTRSGQRFAEKKPAGAILIDDVFTTGATVDECARVLRRGGVQKVIVVTVMRG